MSHNILDNYGYTSTITERNEVSNRCFCSPDITLDMLFRHDFQVIIGTSTTVTHRQLSVTELATQLASAKRLHIKIVE